jgi:hypothetical protein
MSDDITTQIAETIQTAHIQHNPDPLHDINPSTAADTRIPAAAHHLDSVESSSDDLDDDDDDDVPLSVLHPPHGYDHNDAQPRSTQLYPIPDLRFEQSYLHGIAGADTYWKVAWITLVHQVVMPFVQGIGYNLLVLGWRHWGKNVQLHGTSIGARTRRWWWNVNNWKIPQPRQPISKKTN